ncbi:hypothetical protein BH23ACI1_BH23ACI1_06220 [soil metagenome]
MQSPHRIGRIGTSLALAAALAAAGWLAVFVGGPPAQAQGQQALNPAFEQLVDRYLGGGRRAGDRQDPDDMSAASFAHQLDTQRALLKDLRAIDRGTLTFDQDIDYRFLQSLLEGDIIQGENVTRWQQNPRVYISTRPITHKLETDPRAPALRAPELVEDLKLLQVRLGNGKKNLNQYIARWVELSLPMIDGLALILEADLPRFAARLEPGQQKELTGEAARAVAALKDYRAFITTELPKRPVGNYQIGAETYNALHRSRYMFDSDNIHLRRIARGMPGFAELPAYHDWGLRQFEIVERQLEVLARKIDPKRPWLQIIREMKEDHPSAEALVYEHHVAARKTRDWVIEQDLVSIPWDDDDSIMQAADPSQETTQWWGWGPGAPRGSRKSAWTIIPPNPDWDQKTVAENLTEKDYSFMYAIATHEVYPGHHLQRLYQNENPRPLRAAASSYSNQAWCYYIEWELTPNGGFYPAAKQDLYTLEMLRLKLWRMGRVIIDSGLHTGRMSYDDAVTLETERIGFVRRGGQINIDSITEGGSGTAAPTLGYFEWMLLREDYFKKMRELDQRGTLKDFHDRVYKIGFLPVTLVRDALFHELEQEFRPARRTN